MGTADKAWYWLAAGVLALGLNGYYQDGGLQGLHELAGCATTAVAEARAQASEMAALTETTLIQHARTSCRPEVRTEMAVNGIALPAEVQARVAQVQERRALAQAERVQERLARLQEIMVRREARSAKVEFQNGRLAVLTSPGEVRVAVPLARVEVNVPRVPVVP